MSRYDETTGPVPNPSQFYLEWNSELNAFSYWKKENGEGERIAYPLPFRFAPLKFMNSITGYDENRRQGIFSNEVADTRSERLRVLYRDGSTCAQGYYSEIKEAVNAAGGRFTRSIYAVTPKGAIVNIKLKGTQMVSFGAIEKFGKRWQDEWIEVSSFNHATTPDGKLYSIPVFTFGTSFDKKTCDSIDQAYSVVKNYFDSKAPVHFGNQQSGHTDQSNVSMPTSQTANYELVQDDDLPF